MKHQAHASRGGLTVVEVLIALVVMAIAFAALALTQVSTMRMNADSRRMSDATDFANDVLEDKTKEILADYSTVLGACATPDACSESLSDHDSRYQGTLTWGRLGSGYLDEGLIRIAVEVTSPTRVSFYRTVSCIDVNPAPSVALPDPCPFVPAGGGG